MKMSNQKVVQSALIFLLLLSSNVIAQDNFIDFESHQRDRANARIVQFLERKCLIGS